jgi:hypothetical protein
MDGADDAAGRSLRAIWCVLMQLARLSGNAYLRRLSVGPAPTSAASPPEGGLTDLELDDLGTIAKPTRHHAGRKLSDIASFELRKWGLLYVEGQFEFEGQDHPQSCHGDCGPLLGC